MHASPTTGVHLHHGPPGGAPGISQPPPGWAQAPPANQLAAMNEAVWVSIGTVTAVSSRDFNPSNACIGAVQELLMQQDEALNSYEQAMRHNPRSIPAMLAISIILRLQEKFPQAAQYLDQILKLDREHGEAWGYLGQSRSWSATIPC